MSRPGSVSFRANHSGAALVTVVLLAWLLMAACSGPTNASRPTPRPTRIAGTPSVATTPEPARGQITVYAASSLTDAFRDLGKSFESAYPESKVTFNFAASSALATQITEGAPADVFASADNAQMMVVTEKGYAEQSKVFAENLAVIAVPSDDTAVRSLEDLAKPGIKLVLANADVPVGRYAREILLKASAGGAIDPHFYDDVLRNLQSNEANVRAVLVKVQLGEADAGVVYQTDIAAAGGDVKAVEIPRQYNVVARYLVAAIPQSKNPAGAHAFIDYLMSDAGQAILAKYGFNKPGPGQ